MKSPLVTAIVSTYAAERFMRGCMEDLVAQTVFPELEVIVIDSGSPEGESAICAEFVRRYPGQIQLIRTEREPLYAAWNRAIDMARGEFLTNANTDDRHRADFMEIMAAALESRPEIALAYSDQWISRTENEDFETCQRRGAKRRIWPEFSRERLLMGCHTGSQPMWRRLLHRELGYFDTRYRIAADYDMWMRIASRHALLHVDELLGVIFDSPTTISGANHAALRNGEVLQIRREHMATMPWSALVPGLRKALALDYFGLGYQVIARDGDGKAAAPLLREAMRLDPYNLKFAKTYLLRSVLGLGQRRTPQTPEGT